MPTWLKSLLLIGGLAWIGAVYAPYVNSSGTGGFLATDLAVLVDAAGGAEVSLRSAAPLPLQDMEPGAYFAAGGERGSFLSGASLALSRRLWGVSSSSAALYRLENLVLLLVLGLGLANFVRRLLLPWTGADHARAAARALPVVLLVHPFAVRAVAGLDARADLLYLALGAWSAATYLGARQDRKAIRLVWAAILFLGAHLAGGFGLALAIMIGLGEAGSVQRYQRAKRRAVRGLLVACGLVLLAAGEWLLIPGLSIGLEVSTLLVAQGSFAERLGSLVLPVRVAGWPIVLAGLLVLASMHPALRAARHAPRLWGWVLGTWAVILCAALVFVGPVGSGSSLISVSVLTAGLVVVATGVQGFRRLLLPMVLVVGLGTLSLTQAREHASGVELTGGIRADLALAQIAAAELRFELASAGRGTTAGPGILILHDVEDASDWAFARGIGHLLDASLTGESGSEATRRPALISKQALVAFAREPEFADWREGGLVLVVDHEALPLLAPTPPSAPPLWLGSASSPDLNLDPFNMGGLSTRATPERLALQEHKPLPTGIRFATEAGSQVTIEGAWIASRGRTEALFDFSGDLDWLLAGRIKRVWFESGLAQVEACTFLEQLPGTEQGVAKGLVPEVIGPDLRLPVPAEAAELIPLQVPESDGYWLIQFDLTSLKVRSFAADPAQAGELLFRGAHGDLDTWSAGEVAWTLERRVNGCTIWRQRGRAH